MMHNTATDNSPSQCERKQFILSQPKMHKIAMKRNRRLLHSCIIISIFLLASDIAKTNAVPTDSTGARQHSERPRLLHRALRDVATIMTASLVQENHKDVATSTETMLDSQPQGQCLLDGVLIAGTSVECEKQVGCRAIQKTGHCCPDYKCDCERDGKTYLNGDKLVDPETPCTVCYCKGGEILCSSAVCFHRDDCTPRYMPGRCCPEYDNCPIVNKTMTTLTATPKTDIPPPSVLNPSITIKEITKPTEIRITDENKAKPIHEMLKTSTTTTTSTTAAPSATPPSVESSTSALKRSTTTIKSLTLIKVTESAPHSDEMIKPTVSENLEKFFPPPDQSDNRAESPVSQELQRVDSETSNSSNKVNIKREFMFGTTDGPLNGSYIEAISDLSSSELLLGNLETDSSDFNSTFLQSFTDIDPETSGSDNIYHIILSTDGPGDAVSSSINDLTISQFSTTEGLEHDNSSREPTASSTTTDAPLNIMDSTTEILHIVPKATESILMETPISTTTHHHLEDEDAALPVESNPAYPSLPEDDFSIRDVNLPLNEIDDAGEADLKDEQRSIKTDPKTTTTKVEEPTIDDGSGSGSGSDAIKEFSNDTDIYTTNISTVETNFSQNVQLMYSSEDASSGETTISNSSDFKMDKLMHDNLENETGSGDSLEISYMETIVGSEIDPGSGSGNDITKTISTAQSAQKEREPTTPRPMKKPITEIDIDELSGDTSGDGKPELADDPKLDAESLKLDEKDNDSIVQKDTGALKNGIITIKVDPTQDKTIVESVSSFVEA